MFCFLDFPEPPGLLGHGLANMIRAISRTTAAAAAAAAAAHKVCDFHYT